MYFELPPSNMKGILTSKISFITWMSPCMAGGHFGGSVFPLHTGLLPSGCALRILVKILAFWTHTFHLIAGKQRRLARALYQLAGGMYKNQQIPALTIRWRSKHTHSLMTTEVRSSQEINSHAGREGWKQGYMQPSGSSLKLKVLFPSLWEISHEEN